MEVMQGWDVLDISDNSKNLKFVVFEEGATTLRILEAPIRKVRHWIPIQNNSFDCLGADCPVCSINREEYQNTKKNKYNKQERFFMQVIVRDDKEGDYVAILDASKTLASDIRTFQIEVGDVTGFDLKIIRKGTKRETSWNIIPQPIKELSEDDIKLKESMIDIRQLWEAPTKEQFLQILDGKDLSEVFTGDAEEQNNDEVDFTV